MKNFEISLLGETIQNYKITEVLRKGGFATIYLAEDSVSNKKVVIKMARSSLYELDSSVFSRVYDGNAKPILWRTAPISPMPTTIELGPLEVNRILEKEGETLEKISSPCFVKVLNKGAYYGIFYLILEYIEGETLGEVMYYREKVIIQLRYLVDIIEALISATKDGLEYHGDLKPENIIITQDGSVKILDPSSQSQTVPPTQITTPLYNPFLVTDDIDSLGVLLYELFTGFLPFTDSLLTSFNPAWKEWEELKKAMLTKYISPRCLNPELPKELENIIEKALHIKERKARVLNYTIHKFDMGYKFLSEMRDDIKKFMDKTGISVLKFPTENKVDAIMRVIGPYLKKKKQPITIEKILNYIVNYYRYDILRSTFISELGR